MSIPSPHILAIHRNKPRALIAGPANSGVVCAAQVGIAAHRAFPSFLRRFSAVSLLHVPEFDAVSLSVCPLFEFLTLGLALFATIFLPPILRLKLLVTGGQGARSAGEGEFHINSLCSGTCIALACINI